MRRGPVLAAVGLLVAAGPLALAGRPSSLPSGCDGRRAVVVHGTPGQRVPLACSTSTGHAGAESHINVFPDGTVVYTPAVDPAGTLGIGQLPGDQLTAQSNASPASLAVSHDNGAHWSLVKPSGATWNATDHADYVDPVTSRWFFESYGPIPTVPAFGRDQEGPAQLNVSPDGGRTWHRSVIEDALFTENAQFAAAPAPLGGDRPTGYPRVSYFCANLTIGFTSPLIAQRSCYRSLDGGVSWSQRAVILRSSAPIHAECNPYGESISALDGHYPQPGPGGVLYLLISCGPHTFLARSTDEALTFPVIGGPDAPRTIPLPAAPTPDFNASALQVLGDGTLVVVDLESSRLMARTSTDEGRTWSTPVDVTGPGVASVGTWAIAARGSRVALAYYGKHTGDARWYGYVTLLPDPRRHLATVITGQVAKDPLLYGDAATGGPGVQGAGGITGPGGTHLPFPPPLDNHSTGNDFLGAAVGPDGTPWGSFQRDCGPTADSPGCVANGGQTRGIAGRLVFR